MSVSAEQRKKWPIQTGNTVKVWQKIKEGDKTRLQAFEGLVIAHKHGFEAGATFTVRKVSNGIGVEKIFPIFSPNIDKVDLVATSRARRSKLYYVREKAAKEIRRKMKKIRVTKEEIAANKANQEEEKETPVPEEVIEETTEEKTEEKTEE